MNRTALPRAVYPGAMLAETVDIRRAEDRFARRSTNVPVTVMPATEVIAKYQNLWPVEKSFRMSQIRPRRQAHLQPHARRHRGPT